MDVNKSMRYDRIYLGAALLSTKADDLATGRQKLDHSLEAIGCKKVELVPSQSVGSHSALTTRSIWLIMQGTCIKPHPFSLSLGSFLAIAVAAQFLNHFGVRTPFVLAKGE
eukprot:1628332-Amphidinium_carterae.1